MVARIAVLGINLESNVLAPILTEQDFREGLWLEGERLLNETMRPGNFGFGDQLSRRMECEMVPILLVYPEAGGPCEHAFFLKLQARIEGALRAESPLDGVYIHGHGAGTTTQIDDLDGAYFAAVRKVVGPDVPIVALLDLHGHVSELMVDSVDVLVAFRTNPHVDVKERVADCAAIMARLLAGERTVQSLIRAPLLIPQIMQLTNEGEPLGELISYAETFLAEPVVNVSVLSGFPLSDARRCGVSVVVTSVGSQDDADEIAVGIARRAWSLRERFRLKPLCSVAEAAGLAKAVTDDSSRPPLLFADVADNPGGGGRGNTTWLLGAFLEAGAKGCQFGLFYDPPLAHEAHRLGEGARFRAQFNSGETNQYSRPLAADARIIRLISADVMNLRGVGAGQSFPIGPSALLEIAGNFVAVASYRQQLLGPDFLVHFGLEPAEARTIVVKSRGHFRAGFAEYFPPERIIEVEAPGVVTQDLACVAWKHVPRPVYPLDPGVAFSPAAPYRSRRAQYRLARKP